MKLGFWKDTSRNGKSAEGREVVFQDDNHAPGLEMNRTNSPDTNFLWGRLSGSFG